MACADTIKNAFYALTSQVSPRLYNRVSINDPWVAYVEKGEWPTGMGFTINSMMLERTLTDSETGTEWVAATPSGSGDTATTANLSPNPEVLKLFSLTASPCIAKYPDGNFCINDLQNDFMISQTLARHGPVENRYRMGLEQQVPERVLQPL
jgi:hypothetical protein